MPTSLWRIAALTGALIVLGFVVVETVDVSAYTDPNVAWTQVDGHSYARLRVTAVTGTPQENGGLQPGDVIVAVNGLTLRLRYGAAPAGFTQRWNVTRGAQHFTTTTEVTPIAPRDLVLFEIFNVVRLAMVLVAMLVALRRPDDPAARALVTFLVLMGLALVPFGAWLPDALFRVANLLRGPLEILSLSQALLYACLFPAPSPSGQRARLRAINPWYTLVTATAAFVLNAGDQSATGLPDLGPLTPLVEWSPMLYFFAMFRAFALGARDASPRDRQRLAWVGRSIGIGFSGPLAAAVLAVALGRTDEWIGFLPVTLVAMPLGLAYTILRHRTVDVGFVISRALVLTVMSFLIVGAFGLAERTLGKLLIDASHVASRSVEIALALGLGFSLRSLHAQIERGVDRIFFRRRQRALFALKAFANDVYFITDPDVAIERTVDVVNRCADAPNTALYLIADRVFGCAAAIDPGGYPSEISENDPLFVRMRASRQPELVRDAGSDLDAEIAFPMFVRATLVGALVLSGKRTGEAYDPEETALLTDLAQRVGLALDALQTIAVRRELEALTARPHQHTSPS
ncbi:MAG: GAF domain-containing protein [Candidatus Lustribacter sp.]|jgi:hypothetical protein